MIKTKVAFLESRLFSSQSKQFEKFLKSPDWLEKALYTGQPLYTGLIMNKGAVHKDVCSQ